MKAHLGCPHRAPAPKRPGDSRRYAGLSATERRAGRRARLLEAGPRVLRHARLPAHDDPAALQLRRRHRAPLLRRVRNAREPAARRLRRIADDVLAAIRTELYVPGRTWTEIVREAAAGLLPLQMTEDRRRARIFRARNRRGQRRTRPAPQARARCLREPRLGFVERGWSRKAAHRTSTCGCSRWPSPARPKR
jgi:hypothetical protein